MSSKWRTEFGADYEVPKEITENPLFTDVSWGQEMCPAFTIKAELKSYEFPRVILWVEHPNARLREVMEKRFLVATTGADGQSRDILETDDVNLAIERFAELVAVLPTIKTTKRK